MGKGKKKSKIVESKSKISTDLDWEDALKEASEVDSKISQSDKEFAQFKLEIEKALASERYSLQDIEGIFEKYIKSEFQDDPSKQGAIIKYDNLAIARYSRGKVAIEKYGYPANPEALLSFHHAIGIRFEHSKQYDKAITSYKESIKYRDNIDIHMRIANILNDQNREEESLRYCETIKSDHANDPRIVCHKGNMLFHLKRFEEALKCFESLNSLEDEIHTDFIKKESYVESLYMQGRIFDKFGQYERALELLYKSKLHDSSKAELYYCISVIQYKLGFYGMALSAIDFAISLGSANANTYNWKGNILFALGQSEQARIIYQEALKIAENNLEKSELYFNIGVTFYKASDSKNAIKYLRESFELNPQRSLAYEYIVRLLISEHKFEEAFIVYQELQKPISKRGIDLSFLDSIDFSITTITEEKVEEKAYDIEQESALLAQEENDDVEYISQSFTLHERVESLIYDFIDSESGGNKEEYKAELNYMVTHNPSLENFIAHLFLDFEMNEAKKTLEEIFAEEKPSLINKFYTNKKNNLTKFMVHKSELLVPISPDIEGLHKIDTGKKFKGDWFFKLTGKVIKTMEAFLSGAKDRINELRIMKEDSEGKIGFKRHEIETSEGRKSMLKLKLMKDKEICETETIKFVDITGKTHILSIFDYIGNHAEIGKILHTKISLPVRFVNIEEFQSYLVSDSLDGYMDLSFGKVDELIT